MKRLYRSEIDKKIAGVCGGLGAYFDVDPVVFRIIFVILLLPGGFPGLLPYVIMWFIIPRGSELTSTTYEPNTKK